jgi:hypothetical protein
MELGFELLLGLHSWKTGTLPLSHMSSSFAMIILEMESYQTVCMGYLGTSILPILASKVAKITDMSYLHPAKSLKDRHLL